MKQSLIDRLVKPQEQDEKVFDTYKKLLSVMPSLTNEQLSSLNFECWCEARQRTMDEN